MSINRCNATWQAIQARVNKHLGTSIKYEEFAPYFPLRCRRELCAVRVLSTLLLGACKSLTDTRNLFKQPSYSPLATKGVG